MSDSVLGAESVAVVDPAAVEVAAEPVAAEKSADAWRDVLPEDLRGSATLAKFQDVADLAKSYEHLEKTIGKDKFTMPDKHATAEDWRALMGKLGVPEKADEYGLNVPEDAPLEDGFADWYKEKAHELGVLPHQAQALMDSYLERNTNALEEADTAQRAQLEGSLNELKSEWGANFDERITMAKRVVKEIGGQDLQTALNETGAGNDPRIIKAFSKMAEFFAEDSDVRGGLANSGVTPAQALEKARGIMSDSAHPWGNPTHPNHKAAKAEVDKLYQLAYPE